MNRQLLSFLAVVVSVSMCAQEAVRAQTRPSALSEKVAGQATAAVPPSAPIDSSYALGVGDVLEISLVGRSEFGSRVRISADGTILLPMIGVVPATNRTVSDLADQVRQALIKGQFYSDPVVRAEVVGISSRYATILGAVGNPGLLPQEAAPTISC